MAVRSQRVQSTITTTGNTTLYTVPTGFVAKLDKITFVNSDTSTDISGVVLLFGGTAAGNEIIPNLTVPKNDQVSPSVSNHTLEGGDTVVVNKASGVDINVYLSLTERTQP